MFLHLFGCVIAISLSLANGDGVPQDWRASDRLEMRTGSVGAPLRSPSVERVVDSGAENRHEGQKMNASLENTYWRLDMLDGAPFPKDTAAQEPYLVFQAKNRQSYSAILGCNRFHGTYEVVGDQLTFGAEAATLMACPPPLDRLEQDFGKALSEVVSFVIKGDILILKDAEDAPRAILTAADP